LCCCASDYWNYLSWERSNLSERRFTLWRTSEEDSQQQQRENMERRCKAQCNTPAEWRDEKPPRKVDYDHQRERVNFSRQDQGRLHEGERQPRDNLSSSDFENVELIHNSSATARLLYSWWVATDSLVAEESDWKLWKLPLDGRFHGDFTR
jgi:hypothetical protein